MYTKVVILNVPEVPSFKRKKKKSILRTLIRNIIPLLKLIMMFTLILMIILSIVTNIASRHISKKVNETLSTSPETESTTFDFSAYYNETIYEPIIPTENIIPVTTTPRTEDASITVSRGGSAKIYHNIPLSAELQRYAYNICKEEDVPFDLLIGLIQRESSFNPDAISKDGHDFGLCQVRDINFPKLTEELGITDFMNPKNNIRAAVHILSPYIKKYGDESMHLVLMCYNQGESGAKESWKKNTYSTKYTWDIMKNSSELLAKNER